MAEVAFQHPAPEISIGHSGLSTVSPRTTGPSLTVLENQNLAFEIVDDHASLLNLEPEWTALFAAHGLTHQTFQSFKWVSHWCDHFLLTENGCNKARLHIVTARRHGSLVMVLPLVRICAHGQCRIEWLGTPVSQYGDALVADVPDAQGIVAAGFDHLVNEAGNDIIVLRKVREDSVAARVLQTYNPTTTAGAVAPAVTLPRNTSFDTFQNRYSAKARKNRRRHRRRLEEQGVVSFEVIPEGPDATDLIAQALEFKRNWLASRGLLSVAFSDGRTDAFFKTLPQKSGPCDNDQCRLVVYVLRCDGEPIAINVAVRSGDRLLTHIASYDMDFEKFSPGSLLFEEAIAHSLDTGVAVFDLMSPGDAYKLDWTDCVVQVHDYTFGLTMRGKAYDSLYIRRLRPAMKHAARRIPRLVRPFARLLNL